jgi:hypothetical protein
VPEILKNLGLDVYALTDADTDEPRTFTTNSGYWVALAGHIHAGFGSPPFAALLAELDGRGLRKLSSKPAAFPPRSGAFSSTPGAANSRSTTSI